MVAAATNNLCEAANAAVQGHASEEKLISSAKQVAASTAQLLVACKVKADHDSEAMKRLQVSFRLPLQSLLFEGWLGVVRAMWMLSRAHAPCLYSICGRFVGTQAPGCLDFTASCSARYVSDAGLLSLTAGI